MTRIAALVAALCALAVLALPGGAAAAPPAGFQESTVYSGLSSPTAIRFGQDGRVFVAEQGGRILVYDNLFDTTPTVLADLSQKVHHFWDRGLLGLALDPQFPARPYVYVSYTYDAPIGGSPPTWGDACPSPPGATADGCVVSGRLSKLTISGDTMTNEQVLINDWCQQYPSHSIGALAFGQDGALYMSAGDGASFNFSDYGQDGNPLNPCGDPPVGVGGTQTTPSAEGGTLRSQDIRTLGDPTGLDGSLIRVDPDTGAAKADNPNAGLADANARRIVAFGFRNPFRLTVRPGTNEVWLGDVGAGTWEEIDRVQTPTAPMGNFGWPCREGTDGSFSAIALCNSLTPGATVDPYYAYRHDGTPVNDGCPTGSSSISGLAFYNGGSFPSNFGDGLFFADYSRNCIWFMPKGSNGLPNPSAIQSFNPGASGPVDVQVGPGGDLFYVSLSSGEIRRIRYLSGNSAPTARLSSDVTGGNAPLTVKFDGTASSDPDSGDTLLYAWDLDGDGAFDDSTLPKPSSTYSSNGDISVRLRVTDSRGVTDTSAPLVIHVGNNAAPTATLTSPTAATTWRVGDTINFSGSATDPEQGNLPASALTWSLDMIHCSPSNPNSCHTHHMQDFTGVASGSFSAPDHEYPSHLELKLSARDSFGATDTKTVRLDPKTVDLTFNSSPSGAQLTIGSLSGTTPFTRRVIQGSTNSLSATSPQTIAGTNHSFASWSDGGAQAHNIVAGTTPATYTATFSPATSGLVAAYSFEEGTGLTVTDRSGSGNTGTISGATRNVGGKNGSALSFDGVNDWVTVPDSNSLDLTNALTLEAWVRPTVAGSGWRTALLKEQPSNLIYSLYSNSSSGTPSTDVFAGGGDRELRGGSAPLNTWTHLASTYDGTTLRLYVNGTQAASLPATGAISNSTGVLRIGGNAVWPEWFGGLIDDVRVYNRALSTAEIATDRDTPVGPPATQDTQAPSAPATLTANGSLGQAALSWGASTDNVGVTRYNVHRSATAGFTPLAANRIAQVTSGTTHTDPGLAAGTYYYRVIAEDAAGNLSQPSPQAQATVTSDTTPPNVSVSAPAAGATVSSTINIDATASDNVGVVGVQLKVDGNNVGAEDTSSPYSASWNTRTVANGNHTLTAVARDAAGNTRTSAAVTVNVQNTTQTAGLVASYNFEEGTGPTVTDRSGNSNTGTISGATRNVGGHTGSALSFDATNDWVTIADSASLDLTTGMTLEAWIRPTVAGTSWRTVVLKEQPSNLVYSLYANSSSATPSTDVFAGGSDRELRGGSAPLNTWTHLTSTYDGATLRLFVNGTQAASLPATGQITNSTGSLRIGGNAVWPEWFGGLIDDVRVYSRALSAAEIAADRDAPVN